MNPYRVLELERCRRDRQKLLQFIISSSNLVREVQLPAGSRPASLSSTDLDTLSADYLLQCISSGDGVLDVSEATKDFRFQSEYPVVVHARKMDSYFTVSDPKVSGPPPRRTAPSINAQQSSSYIAQPSSKMDISKEKSEHKVNFPNGRVRSSKQVDLKAVPSLGLPPLKTGLSDDDLRESAYEILLACIGFSGIDVLPDQGRMKERSSKMLSGLKNKKDKVIPKADRQQRDFALIDNIRLQMQVSEATDLCIRQKLMLCISRVPGEHTSILQILLGFINNISKSSFLNEKSYSHWIKRQANVTEELLFSVSKYYKAEGENIKNLVGKIRNTKEWNLMSPTERAEILVCIRNSAVKARGQFVSDDPNVYQAAGYHLKLRLYEQLLIVVFDILDEGQLIKEADEVLKLIKSTWSTLGITQIIHDTLFGWVLFKQFLKTDEDVLLEYAIQQLQKVLASESCGMEERKYLGSLRCSSDCNGTQNRLSLVSSIFSAISVWFNGLLQDYHLHFRQIPSEFCKMLSFALAIGASIPNECGEITEHSIDECRLKKVKMYVHDSVLTAYTRVTHCRDSGSSSENINSLKLLADGLMLIIEKEISMFCPVVHRWCLEAGMISSTLLFQAFEEHLGISSFPHEVRLVLSAAHVLDQELTKLHKLACEENESRQLPYVLDHYHIAEVSGPLILDWVISQHSHILDWIDRAFHLEDWEPLSFQQKHAVSVVEVFRMIEETVDQFFKMNLPVNITHLQALLSVVFHCLDAYLTKVVSHLVEKSYLYPPVPSLTRYEELVFPGIKKKLVECNILENEVDDTVNELTLSKLCVRLSSVNYIRSQMDTLEQEVRKSWGLVKPVVKRRWFNIEESSEILERTMSTCDESVDELFASTFDGVRSAAADSICKIVDFLGARVTFCDLKEPLLRQLYHSSVEGARMDSVLPHIDEALNRTCGLVDSTMRDSVALSIFRSLLVGYVWVLLDGGPSRAFSNADFSLMEDDFRVLKDFFVADGEGLPRSVVEKEAKFAGDILSLFSFETGTIIRMLMAASEDIPVDMEVQRHAPRRLDDANTLIRVLCHKKDKEASKFLKRQYRLPASSEYSDKAGSESPSSSSSSGVLSDLLQRSASIRSASSRWSEAGHSSFKSFRKRFQEGSFDVKNLRW